MHEEKSQTLVGSEYLDVAKSLFYGAYSWYPVAFCIQTSEFLLVSYVSKYSFIVKRFDKDGTFIIHHFSLIADGQEI